MLFNGAQIDPDGCWTIRTELQTDQGYGVLDFRCPELWGSYGGSFWKRSAARVSLFLAHGYFDPQQPGESDENYQRRVQLRNSREIEAHHISACGNGQESASERSPQAHPQPSPLAHRSPLRQNVCRRNRGRHPWTRLLRLQIRHGWAGATGDPRDTGANHPMKSQTRFGRLTISTDWEATEPGHRPAPVGYVPALCD